MLKNNIKQEAICGNCCKRWDEHYHEELPFCNKITNGDIFTDEPNEHAIYDYLMDKEPSFMAEIVNKWKRDNGHEYITNDGIVCDVDNGPCSCGVWH